MLSGTFCTVPMSHRMNDEFRGAKLVERLLRNAVMRGDELTKEVSTATTSPRRNSIAPFGGTNTKTDKLVVPSNRAASIRIEKVSPMAAEIEL